MTDFDWAEFAGERWNATNVGDSIKGKITKLGADVQSGGRYPVLTLQIDAEGNEREVHATATDLKQQLANIAPQVGWWVSIEMTGEKQTGKPSPMKIFEVKVKPPQAPEPAAAPAIEPDPEEAPFTTAFDDELI